MLGNSDQAAQTAIEARLNEIIAGVANQTELINQRLTETIHGLDNQSQLINQRMSENVQGLDNQSEAFTNSLDKLVQGIQNQSERLSNKLDKLIEGQQAHLQLVGSKLDGLDDGIKSQSQALPIGNPSHPLIEQHNEHDAGIARTIRAIDAKGNPLIGPKEVTVGNDEFDDDMPSSPDENRLERFQYIFESILAPPEVEAPPGFLVDFMGILLDSRFATSSGHDAEIAAGGSRRVTIPTLRENYNADSEWWFETVDWFVAALEARGQFVMVSLGASYGAQPVGAYKALQMVNPLPVKLVAVEADPQSCNRIRQHFRDNGINPEDHWIVQAAVSDTAEPVLFPIGASGLGSNNCVSTNEPKARDIWIETIKRNGDATSALENLIRYGSTGLMHNIGGGCSGEVKFVSAITVADLLSPFDKVDLLECDIQQSEIVALPPYLDLLRRKVKRIHIGTHGEDVHRSLHRMFAKAGWDVVFNYKPNATHQSPWGRIRINDGVLTVQNPDFSTVSRNRN